jgi:lipoyl(octanoyl) transferase
VDELWTCHLGSVEYREAVALQERLRERVQAGELPDLLLLLEHPPVYTTGRRSEPGELPVGGDIDVVETDRGGKLTYHGPGQLVGYPIVRLPEAVGVVDYVRRLEEAMIALFAGYGLTTGRVRGRSGVWLAADDERPERKIAAIGVRVAAGTTMHGFAINVDPDLAAYATIVPCGLVGVGVTSMAAELGRPVPVAEVAAALVPHLADLLTFAPYAQSADLGRRPELSTAG